ncbi:MAG: XdhC family protein [Kiritimatiellae bacterium]|nr:XdhC family protein [Kiritimatiellia bacterium]MCO5067184.1 XdhC family protein [Kiritimatiellia bacterium]
MKSWQETTRVFTEIKRLFDAGESVALSTLVKIEGSSYRRPGAKLLIRADGSMLGQVSGGCLEVDLRERAQQMLETAAPPTLVHYDTGADDNTLWGLGLGCDGKLDAFLQRLDPKRDAESITHVLKHLLGLEAFAMRTALDGPHSGAIHTGPPTLGGASGIVANDGEREFVDYLEPPPDLVVVGAGDDSIPLVALAAQAGFRVTVVDHRSAHLTHERFPDAQQRVQRRAEAGLAALPQHGHTYVVIKNHAIAIDKAWAALFAETPVPYIGLMGPKSRREDILESLPDAVRPRIYGPAGLDVKAEGGEQIAVSIVAEMLAVHAGREGGFLRQRSGSIHA